MMKNKILTALFYTCSLASFFIYSQESYARKVHRYRVTGSVNVAQMHENHKTGKNRGTLKVRLLGERGTRDLVSIKYESLNKNGNHKHIRFQSTFGSVQDEVEAELLLDKAEWFGRTTKQPIVRLTVNSTHRKSHDLMNQVEEVEYTTNRYDRNGNRVSEWKKERRNLYNIKLEKLN